jgi:hypothetical protein
MRHIVIEEGGTYRANPKEAAVLAFYANAIAHLLPGTNASALGRSKGEAAVVS